MNRHIILAGLLGACVLAGCAQAELGTERSLGQVQYADAFNAARTVTGQYFTVAYADEPSGVINAQPQAAAPAQGLLTNYAERQVATVCLRRRGEEVVAYAKVELQRQGVAAKAQTHLTGGYDGPPRQTPAELEAATTPQQNEYWITHRRDRALEMKVLADIYRALHGEGQEEQGP